MFDYEEIDKIQQVIEWKDLNMKLNQLKTPNHWQLQNYFPF